MIYTRYEGRDVTHPNEKFASEETMPRLFRIIFILINQHQPLIAMDNDFTTNKFHLHTNIL